MTHMLLDRLPSIGTLSISDQPNFRERGGMSTRRIRECSVKCRFDVEHMRRTGVHVNAKPLRLSDLVGSDRAPSP